MKASKVKELIKQSLLELEAEKKNTSNSGPMTPEEEEMIKRYEEEEANKYALEKEEPLEEATNNVHKLKTFLRRYINSGAQDSNDRYINIEWFSESNVKAKNLEELLNSLGIEYEYDLETDGGAKVHMFKINKEQVNKYILNKEEPLEEGDVMKKAREIVAKHKEMTEGEEGPEDISDYDRGKIETGKANTLARSINAAIVEVDPELHVETFAKGVAQVLKREYGSHLTKEFIAALRDNLRGYEDIVTEADRIVESWKRKNLLKETKKKHSKILKENAVPSKEEYNQALRDIQGLAGEVAKNRGESYESVFEKAKAGDDEILDIMWDKAWSQVVKYAINVITAYTRSGMTESKKKDRKALKESADLAVSKHSAGLLKALGARAKYPEDEIAYREVEKHLKAIATELGLDASLPFMEDEMYSGKAKPEEALKYTKEMFNSWLEDSGMTENEKPVSDYSERREREKDYTSAKSDKPKKSHTSDSYEESDYMKRRKKEMNEINDPDKETIESWYHKTNFYIDDLTPEEIEKGIQAHYEEWTAVKDQYGTIEDYFADVEKNGDWY